MCKYFVSEWKYVCTQALWHEIYNIFEKRIALQKNLLKTRKKRARSSCYNHRSVIMTSFTGQIVIDFRCFDMHKHFRRDPHRTSLRLTYFVKRFTFRQFIQPAACEYVCVGGIVQFKTLDSTVVVSMSCRYFLYILVYCLLNRRKG